MKKIETILSSLLALSLLSSCGTGDNNSPITENNTSSSTQSTTDNSDMIHLTLWHYYNGTTKDTLDEMIAQFNHTLGNEENIQVEAFSYSSVSDISAAAVSAAQGEVGVADLPDIFAAYSDTALLLNDMDKLAALDDYFTAEELALYQQDFLKEGRFDSEGTLRIIPVAKSTELVYLNETDFDVFSQATGYDVSELATWEGMARVAEGYYHWTDSLTPEEPDDGKALFGVDSEANLLIISAKQLGEEMYLFEEEGTVFNLSESTARTIWNTQLVPYIKGHYAALGGYRSDDVKSGDLLAYVGSTSSVYYFPTMVELGRADSYDIEGVSLPYPYFEQGSPVAVQQGAGMVVSQSTPERENAAATFLKWFTAADNNLIFAVSTGYIPVQQSVLTQDSVTALIAEEGEDIPSLIRSTMEMTYNQEDSMYEYYATVPFHGSYDTRNVLRDSMQNVVGEAKLRLTEENIQREILLPELVGEDAFQSWYTTLHQDITEILEANN